MFTTQAKISERTRKVAMIKRAMNDLELMIRHRRNDILQGFDVERNAERITENRLRWEELNRQVEREYRRA